MGSPVHRAKRAVAASATALAAFVLFSGPTAAIAVARPGDSTHSHGGRDSDRGGNRGRDDGSRKDRPRNDSRRGESNGFGRGEDSGKATSTTNSGGTSRPAATTATTASRAPQAVASTGDSEAPTPTISASAADAGASSGSGVLAAAPDLVAPKVTFGNGRTPGEGAIHPIVSLPQQGVTVALPAMLVPAPVPLGIPQAVDRPRARLDLSASSGWDSARPGQPMTSWFGLAGLLLIPLGGAALGYRQARAAKSASHLAVH